jgi:hypothetical protein
MSKITIVINTDNDAFVDYKNEELARILIKLANQIKDDNYPSKLMDINGAAVGTVKVEED